MPVDATIPLSVKPLDFNAIAEMRLKRAALEKIGAEKAVGQATQEATDESGVVDYGKRGKLIADKPEAAFSADTAAVTAQNQKKLQLELKNEQQTMQSRIAGGWAMNDASPDQAASDIDKQVRDGILDPKTAMQVKAQIYAAASSGDPKALRGVYTNIFSKTKEGQDAIKQQLQATDTGANIQYRNVNPLTPQGMQTGFDVKKEPAPVSGLTQVENPDQSISVVPTQDIINRGGTQVTQGAGVEESRKTMSDDFQKTKESAANAANDIATLQNIKKYAKGAATGALSEKRAFVNALGELIGIEGSELAKTDTDLLAKNSSMLALAGGNTDLARTMAESVNPNAKMSQGAIEKAADQLISIKQMQLAKQKYLGQFIGDPSKYTQELTKFNQIADPRILQLQSMSAKDKAEMKASMNEKERADFGRKVREFEKLGILQ